MGRQTDILMAAQNLFGRHGLRKVTTDDIAREAHVSKSTIYKQYRNKQEILRAVVRYEMDELLQNITESVAAEHTVEGKLRAHLMTKISTVHNLINLHQVTTDSLREHWEYAGELHDEFVSAESEIIREILEWGVKKEGLDIPAIGATAYFLARSLESLEIPWVIEDLNLTVQAQVDIMLGIVLNGLRCRR